MKDLLTEEEAAAVYEIIGNELGVAREQLGDEAILVADLGADSLDEVQIVMQLEERFKITIPDEMADRAKTVGEVLNSVAELLERER